MPQDKKHQVNNNAAAEAAMLEVLQSENAAKEKVAVCEAEAQKRLREARLKSQRINRRTDKRISLIHERFERMLSDEIARIKRMSGEGERERDIDCRSDALLEQVVDHIADTLTR